MIPISIWKPLLIHLAVWVYVGGEEKVNYSGYSVFRTADSQHPAIKTLQSTFEVWKVVMDNSTYLDILVTPRMQGVVKQLLSCADAPYTVTIPDLQKSINQENIPGPPTAQFRGSCSSTSGMSWIQYHSYHTLSRYIDCLAAQHGHTVELHNIGISSEGRGLKVLKIGSGSRRHGKPAIWIDGGIHAREWISPATVSYIMGQLVENPSQYRAILDKFDFYVMPSANPDGYEYSRNFNRMWRKTRSTHATSSCKGVDPNRNFDYVWGGEGTSNDPCSDIYKGPNAFSEPETSAMANFILARRKQIKMYLTFHSYGQVVLYPWGYAIKDHSDETELHRVGNIASRAMGNKYVVGSAAKVFYPAAGASDDWAKGSAGIRYSYTIELPDRGKHGFILPAKEIRPVASEALEAVIRMAESIKTT